MNSKTITCPKCQSSIPLDEVLFHDVEEELKKKYEEKSKSEIDEIRKKSLEWKEAEKKKLAQELEEEAIKKARDLIEEETKKLRFQLDEARGQELVLRKEKNVLEDQKKSWELEKQRQIDQEREKIRVETSKVIYEEHHLKITEKDKQIDSMRRTIEELQIKASVTSQQLQGEVLELELEQILKTEFPTDHILPVPKGVNGADVIQVVHDSMGRECGTIVWESKRTKAFAREWVQKLKDDLRSSKADVAVLVTTALPEGIKNFGPKDGIYVTNFECLISLAKFIRLSLIQLCLVKTSVVGKNEKMEMIYNYLAGNEFRQRVEAIIEAFSAMKKDLEDEKKAFIKIWAKREKEIERVVNNTVGMHGDLQGLMGTSLPQIPMLEVSVIAVDSENLF